MTDSSPLDVAERLFAAIQSGDTDAVSEVYSPNVKVWHNNDQVTQGREDNLRVIGWLAQNIPDLRYEEVRRQALPNGFVQQHVLRGTAPNGKLLEVPACIICEVVDGHVTRLDEYLDSAHTSVLLG
ncbi:MAG: nuclear transport factor 2 family protein [Tepidiformaceae bacterium]